MPTRSKRATRKAPDALAASEARYRVLVETSHDLIWAVDADGRITFMNQASRRIYGREPEEMIGRPWLEFVPPGMREAQVETFRQMLQTGAEVFNYEATVYHKDGRQVVLSANARVLRDRDGNVAGTTGCSRDITDLQRAQTVLRESEARFRSLTELSADWYWEQDAAFRFTESSASAEGRAGLAAGTLAGRCRWELEGIKPLSSSWEAHRAGLEAHRPFRDFEYLRVDAEGSPHFVSVSGEPVFDAQGRFRGYRGVARDITERKLAERALTRSEQRHRLLFEASPLPLYVYDRETLSILAVNARMERQYGWSREELEGMSMLELRPPEERARAEASARGPVEPHERRLWRHWRRGGERFDAEVTAHDIEFNGRPARLVSPVDVTEREITERTLRDLADNLRSLSQRLVKAQENERRALARALHDRAGQNLTALAIHLEILREGAARLAPEELERRLRESAELTEATARMLDDVTAELRPPMLDDFGLGAALQWYARQQAALTGFAIEVRLPEAPLPAAGERDLALFRIVQEALTNVARHAHASRVEIALAQGADGLELTVRDDGRGLDPEAEPHTHSRLGLRTMRERAVAVGGRLELETAPGGGTLVRVRAP